MSEARPLLIGEFNPYGFDAEFALYPLPVNASGDRLCRFVMGLEHEEYLRRFDRMNLCRGKWSLPAARSEARRILNDGRRPTVLCGAKVAAAFGLRFLPFTVAFDSLVVLPHPSGLNRLWHEPNAVNRARAALRDAGVMPSADEGREKQ